VWLYAESNNFILQAVVLEFYRGVALMAVDNEQPMCPSRGRLRMGVEVVLEPRQRDVVISPASRTDSSNLVAGYTSEPRGDKNLAYKDKEGWDGAPYRSDALYEGNPLAIARL
jgi:hypothetical protein